MALSKMRDNIERWLIHQGLSFKEVKEHENTFQVLVKNAGQYGTPVEIFEPGAQRGVLVIGAKVILKNNQTARYLAFNEVEKKSFEKKIADFCSSIHAINRNFTEDGKQKIGVYVVLDEKCDINQQTVFDSIDRVSEMHEKTSRFLMKTF